MPIYEYACEHCGDRFEKLRPTSAAGQPIPCPACGRPANPLVSRLARITGTEEGGDGGDGGEAGAESTAMPGHGHSHGHSHGPGGHTH
ncbi:MAG TPA: zinc ribbon domain-containing protein [Dehalococcoidia bacterium]|nr:zinc ribbon domain-containing protein [Dehalococcoidia bacterium]